MTRPIGLLMAVSLVVGLFGGPEASAADDDPTVRVLVPADRAPQTLAAQNPNARWVSVEVPLRSDMEATLEAARARYGPDVALERVYELMTNPGDDDFYDEQWHLENDANDADIDATTAWTVADGSGTVVAVIDSGVEASHPDLAGQVIDGWDYVDGDDDPSPVGTGNNEAHATAIAGLIAATDNDIGVIGVAPGAKILNMRACEGGFCAGGHLVNAIYDSVDRGADVINLSVGSYGTEDLAFEAAIDYARLRNVVIFAAAGNEDTDLDRLEEDEGLILIPGGLTLDNIVTVGASDWADERAEFSNFGSVVDVFAPGVDMVSTGLGSSYVNAPGGTSFSTPIAAGIAALLLSHDPDIGYQEQIARLTAFADRPSALAAYSTYGRVNGGKTLTNRFIDTSESVFNDAIKWLAEQHITEGCNPPQNHEYCPGNDVTRGQMAVFFARAFGLPATSTDHFDDDDGQFYESSANRMAEAGITVGCDSGKYCGNRDISRGEMAAMLSRVLGLASSNTDHFADDDGSTFESAINRIADARVTQGCNPPTNDRFCGDRDVNRGQMAAFLQRALNPSD